MNMVPKFLILTIILHSAATEFVAQCSPREKRSVYTNNGLRCGEILTANKGEIHYTPTANAFANERCVWIIAVPQVFIYDVYIERLDSSINTCGGSSVLIITDEHFRNYLPTCTSWHNLMSRFLIVTFATGHNATMSSGFTLKYEIDSRNPVPEIVLGNSTHYLRTHPSTWHRYPNGPTLYNQNERAIQAFLPANNYYSGNNNTLRYRANLDAGNICWDGVIFRKFQFSNVSSSHVWWQKVEKWICESAYEVSHTDIMVSLLISYDKRAGSSFSLQFM